MLKCRLPCIIQKVMLCSITFTYTCTSLNYFSWLYNLIFFILVYFFCLIAYLQNNYSTRNPVNLVDPSELVNFEAFFTCLQICLHQYPFPTDFLKSHCTNLCKKIMIKNKLEGFSPESSLQLSK